MNHTPEPWQSELCLGNAYSICKKAANGDYIKRTMGELFNRADAHRLITCVNACAGMEDPEKEIAALKERQNTLLSELDLAEHKLDKLRADYKALRDAMEHIYDYKTGECMYDEIGRYSFPKLQEIAREALDKTKEAE
jgi:hypothetical protein